MAEQTRQWEGKTGGGTFGQKSLFLMLKVINVTALYPVLFVVIPFYMLFGRKGYIAIMRYFKQCHRMPAWKAFRQTYRNYLVFGQVVLDKFAILAGNKKNFKEAEITGKACFDALMQKDTGFIIASSHIGNFELSGHLFRQNQKRLYGLVYGGESKELQQRRIEVLQKANLHTISVEEDMSHLFTIKQALEEGGIVTIPCDRIYGSPKKIKHNFLGREACFPLGPFRLAVQMNVPMVALFMMKDSYKKYHAYVLPIETGSEEQNLAKRAHFLAVRFIRNCEEIVRKYPRQWFNFYDFWKTD